MSNKQTIQEKVNDFIKWLLKLEQRRRRPLTECDYHAIGLYAMYIAEKDRK